jgi:hypothetical protein
MPPLSGLGIGKTIPKPVSFRRLHPAGKAHVESMKPSPLATLFRALKAVAATYFSQIKGKNISTPDRGRLLSAVQG